MNLLPSKLQRLYHCTLFIIMFWRRCVLRIITIIITLISELISSSFYDCYTIASLLGRSQIRSETLSASPPWMPWRIGRISPHIAYASMSLLPSKLQLILESLYFDYYILTARCNCFITIIIFGLLLSGESFQKSWLC